MATALEHIQKAIDTMSKWADKINAGFAKTDSNESRLDTLEPTSSDHEARITQNEADIDTNETDIATNAGNIATNAGNIATNTTNIAANATAISRITVLGPWDATKTDYKKGNIVRDGSWSAMALTDDPPVGVSPSPQPDGSRVLPADGASFSEIEYGGILYTGQKYTFTQSGWLTELRVYVTKLTEFTNYRILLLDETNPNAPIYRSIEEPILKENDWTTVALDFVPVAAGTVLTVVLDAFDSGDTVGFQAGYLFADQANNPDQPTTGQWTFDSNDDYIYIHETDLDGVPHPTEIGSLIVGSSIRVVQTNSTNNFRLYSVAEVGPVTGTEPNRVYRFTVNEDDVGGFLFSGAVTTLTTQTAVNQTTKAATQVDFWDTNQPDFATVEGVFRINNVPVGIGEESDVFGVDIGFQRAAGNPNWGIIGQFDVVGLSSEAAIQRNPTPNNLGWGEVHETAEYAEELQSGGLTGTNATEEPEFRSADFIHDSRNAYLCDVSGGNITMRIPADIDDSCTIFDAANQFGGGDGVTVEIMNPDGVTVDSTFFLNDKNRSYSIFKSGGSWYWVRNDRGEVNGPF